MKGSKQEILAFLKRTGGGTVDGLAQGIGLSPVTVRQHLTALQRDNLVEASAVRRPTGRPHYEYRLTRSGEDTFPRRYDRLVEMLLQEIAVMDLEQLADLQASQRTSFLLRRLSHRLALQHAPQVQNRRLEERVAAVTEILQADGGFAEWEKTACGYEIRDYNCIFSHLETENGVGCEWHLNFLRWVLGAEVRAEEVDGCARCCRYVVELAPEIDGRGASNADGRPLERLDHGLSQ